MEAICGEGPASAFGVAPGPATAAVFGDDVTVTVLAVTHETVPLHPWADKVLWRVSVLRGEAVAFTVDVLWSFDEASRFAAAFSRQVAAAENELRSP